MPARFSPPLKPIRLNHTPSNAPSLRHRSRGLYLVLLVFLLCLWYTSTSYILPHRPPTHSPSLIYKNVDWSRYAYSQYATNSAYLCSAVMIFESLSRLGSKADRILLYPQDWDLDIASSSDRDSQLLVKARDEYDVKLTPVEIPKGDDAGWNGSFTKFMTWGQTQYDRVLHLDADATMLKHMDELFLAPRAPVAMLRAYWKLSAVKELTSLFILLEPSELDYQQLMVAARPDVRRKDEYDMEILNRFYGDSAMVLSHREYGLLSEEFRTDNHRNYLGSSLATWDPERVMREASLVHFSDWPLPKPWIMWPHNLIGEVMPKCNFGDLGNDDCRNKKIWMELYDDFRRRRKKPIVFLQHVLYWTTPNLITVLDMLDFSRASHGSATNREKPKTPPYQQSKASETTYPESQEAETLKYLPQRLLSHSSSQIITACGLFRAKGIPPRVANTEKPLDILVDPEAYIGAMDLAEEEKQWRQYHDSKQYGDEPGYGDEGSLNYDLSEDHQLFKRSRAVSKFHTTIANMSGSSETLTRGTNDRDNRLLHQPNHQIGWPPPSQSVSAGIS